MWELERVWHWAPNNWCFPTVVLEKTLEGSLNSKEIKPVDPKENPPWIFCWKDWCWSWISNTLTTWWEELTHWKNTLMLGKIEGKRRRGQQRMYGIIDSMDVSLSKLLEIVRDREACRAAVCGVAVRHHWQTEQQQSTSTALNNSGDRDHPYFVLGLNGNASDVSTLSFMLVWGFR